MSIIDNIFARFGYTSTKQFDAKLTEAVKAEFDSLPDWLGETAEAYRWRMPDPSIFANQADLYRLSPILGTAVSILANDIGTAKFNVFRMVGEEEREIKNHPLELLLRNPNPADSGMEHTRDTTSNYLLNGNAVWWQNKVSPTSEPDEFWTIPFSMIQPITDRQRYIDHWDYFPGDGSTIRMETWEIVHFKTYNPNNPFIGLSPLESLADTIHGDLGMRKTNRIVYNDYGGQPPSVMLFKDYPDNETWKDINESVRKAAIRNQMMLLRGVGDGVTWLSRAANNKDSDYIASLKTNLTDMFNRMCPGLLSMLSESSTEANAYAGQAFYAAKTLYPMEEVLAQKITSDILPAYERKLIGRYEDPRYVDKKLTLEEQTAFERTHTLAEVRKEYYQDAPLGDERDSLLPSQITSGKATPEEQPPAGPVEPESQLDKQQDMNEDMQENPQPEPASKAMFDDLMKYQRKAIKKVGKPIEFASDILPADTLATIKAQLETCTDAESVKTVFDKAREELKPKPQIDAMIILRSIEAGVRAMELKGR